MSIVQAQTNTFIHHAAEGKTANIIHMLDDFSQDVDGRDKDGSTALMWAARQGHLETVIVLLRYGANPNIANRAGETALDLAMECQAKPGAQKDRYTAVAEEILKRNVDFSKNRRFVEYLFQEDTKEADVVRYLRNAAKVTDLASADGQEPLLHRAVRRGHKELTSLLLERGCDPRTKDASGRSALSLCPDAEMADVMIGKWGHKMLCNLVAAGQADQVGKLIQEINQPALLDDKTSGKTALHYAVARNDFTMVNVLIRAGANTQVTDGKEQSPLVQAVRAGHQDLVRFLLDNGADVNGKGAGQETALSWALADRKRGLAMFLLDRGANPNVPVAGRQQPALHWAILAQDADLVKKMSGSGVRFDAVDEKGKTALDCAAAVRNAELMTFIKGGIAGGGAAWEKNEPHKVACREIDMTLNRELVSIFNFKSRERVTVLRDPVTNKVESMFVQGFDQISDKGILEEALAEFQKRGGVTDRESIYGRVTERKKQSFPKPDNP